MNYKLAKQLEKAGFRQEGNGVYLTIAGEKFTKKDLKPGEIIRLKLTELTYIPTLLELIEACEDRFGELNQIDKGIWIASFVDYKNKETYSEKGKTPEIAVAKLWLKLNSKTK